MIARRVSKVLLAVAVLAVARATAEDALRAQPQAKPQTATGPVLPLRLPEQNDPAIRAVQDRLYRAAMRQGRYLLGLVKPWEEDPSMSLLTRSRSEEHWVRPNSGAVEGFAILYRFGSYDEKTLGVSRRELLEGTILPMLRYLVATHVTGTRPTSDGKPWGDAWQSAYWAQMLGRAAWFVWDDLPEGLRAQVRRVVVHEAERIARAEPPHQIKSDTKAEENAWNSEVLSAAMLLAPDHPRRPAWEKAFQKWVFSSLLRPADARSDAVVDGRTVREQFTGANVYDDFTLENHGFVHPDYMQCFGLSLGCALDYHLTGRKPPEALLYNVAGIYENLKWFLLPDGGFVYPNGQDWELFRNAAWVRSHLLMAVYGGDPDSWHWAGWSLETLERMQARSPQGNVFLPEEYFFASTQTDLFRSLGHSWLILQTAGPVKRGFRDRRGVRRLDSGGIILNRTGGAVHTLAWGARVMAQCVPYRLDRVVSPIERSGIGHVRLQGAKEPLPLRLAAASVKDGPDWFIGELTVDHGGKVRAELRFQSAADGAWTMREKLTALDDLTTAEVATGLVGVLNNRTWVYERGRREVAFGGKTTAVGAQSGKTIEDDAAHDVAIDGVLSIHADKPLRVRYFGASQPERARATERLYLNYLGGQRAWKKGEAISEWEAVVRVKIGAEGLRTELKGETR